jgi:hypothetical protein
MKEKERALPLRILVLRPPRGVTFALQKGKSDANGNADLVGPDSNTADSLSFEFSVRVGAGKVNGSLRFLGDFTQGPPAQRFVYLNSGKRAGQTGTAWDRRAKIPLTTITPAMMAAVSAAPGSALEIQIEGTGNDGGPVCATVKRSSGWHQVRS